MAVTDGSVVIGVFPDIDKAKLALDELRRAGFADDEIGFLTRARTEETSLDLVGEATRGAVGGGALGGLLGAAASLLIPGFGPAVAGGILATMLGGAVLGVFAGGVINTLMSLGLVERDARLYQKELENGHTVVTVKVSQGLEEAQQILKQSGATQAKIHEGIITTTPAQSLDQIPPDGTEPPAGELR